MKRKIDATGVFKELRLRQDKWEAIHKEVWDALDVADMSGEQLIANVHQYLEENHFPCATHKVEITDVDKKGYSFTMRVVKINKE